MGSKEYAELAGCFAPGRRRVMAFRTIALVDNLTRDDDDSFISGDPSDGTSPDVRDRFEALLRRHGLKNPGFDDARWTRRPLGPWSLPEECDIALYTLHADAELCIDGDTAVTKIEGTDDTGSE